MSISLEYLYWRDIHKELKCLIGHYTYIYNACMTMGAVSYWAYAPGYQFHSPWVVYNSVGITQCILDEVQVPEDVRAMHLLVYRGDYA